MTPHKNGRQVGQVPVGLAIDPKADNEFQGNRGGNRCKTIGGRIGGMSENPYKAPKVMEGASVPSRRIRRAPLWYLGMVLVVVGVLAICGLFLLVANDVFIQPPDPNIRFDVPMILMFAGVAGVISSSGVVLMGVASQRQRSTT